MSCGDWAWLLRPAGLVGVEVSGGGGWVCEYVDNARQAFGQACEQALPDLRKRLNMRGKAIVHWDRNYEVYRIAAHLGKDSLLVRARMAGVQPSA